MSTTTAALPHAWYDQHDPTKRTRALEWWPTEPRAELAMLYAKQRGEPGDTWGPPATLFGCTLEQARRVAAERGLTVEVVNGAEPDPPAEAETHAIRVDEEVKALLDADRADHGGSYSDAIRRLFAWATP